MPKVSGTPAFAGVTGVDGVRSVLVGPVPLWLRLLASSISPIWLTQNGGILSAYRSLSRGISSTKLQGRKRLSSWWWRILSQPSFTAPFDPGSAKI